MKTLDHLSLPEHIRSVILEASDRLKSKFPVSRVILFGSQARQQAQPDSDIDLLVLTTCPVTRELKDQISDILFELDLEKDVVLTSICVQQDEWDHGLVSVTSLHREVEKDGCLI